MNEWYTSYIMWILTLLLLFIMSTTTATTTICTQQDTNMYLEPDFRQNIASHCDMTKLSSSDIEEMNRWSEERSKHVDRAVCRKEMKKELQEEWLHINRQDICDFSKYIMPTFPDQSFLTPDFRRETLNTATKPILAFFIIVYRQPEFLERMIARLQSEDARHMILIHIDVKSSYSFELSVKRIVSKIPNVRVVRFGSIVYGSSTVVQYVTSAMRYFEENYPHWDFFIPLTGQDYPLLSASQFARVLTYVGNRTWVIGSEDYKECGTVDKRGKVESPTLQPQIGRTTHFHYPCNQNGESKLHRLKTRKAWLFDDEESFLFCKGTTMSSGIFHRNEVKMFVNDLNARKAYAFFRHTMIPEEHIWVSILTNLVSKDRVVERAPCFMSWTMGAGSDGIHNTFLTMKQVDLIKEAFRQGKVFARKFDMSVDSDILDWIDAGGLISD